MNRGHLKVSMPDAEYTCVLRTDGSALDLAATDVALNLRGQHDHVNRSATQWRTAGNLRRWQYPMGEGGDGTHRIWSSLEATLSLFPVRDRRESIRCTREHALVDTLFFWHVRLLSVGRTIYSRSWRRLVRWSILIISSLRRMTFSRRR